MSPPGLTCSLRDRSNSSSSIRRSGNHYGYRSLGENLGSNPLACNGQSLLQSDGGFPTQHPTQAGIVAVPTTHALRSFKVVSLRDLFATDPRPHADQFVNRHEFIRSQIKRVAIVRSHDPDKSFHTIIHIHKRACLLAITPHFDLAIILSESDLATDRGWRLFLAAFVRAKRPVNVMKADDSRLKAIVFVVVTAEFFSKELLPAIARLGISGMGIFLTQRSDGSILLLALVVDTCGRGEQETLDPILTAGLEHMGIDQDVMATDVGEIRSDIANAAHVGGKVIDLIDPAARGQEAVFCLAQIKDLKRVACRSFVFRILDVNSPDPMPVRFESLHQMVANKTACARYQYPLLLLHIPLSPESSLSQDPRS